MWARWWLRFPSPFPLLDRSLVHIGQFLHGQAEALRWKSFPAPANLVAGAHRDWTWDLLCSATDLQCDVCGDVNLSTEKEGINTELVWRGMTTEASRAMIKDSHWQPKKESVNIKKSKGYRRNQGFSSEIKATIRTIKTRGILPLMWQYTWMELNMQKRNRTILWEWYGCQPGGGGGEANPGLGSLLLLPGKV